MNDRTFRLKITCPECDAVCEVEARCFWSARIAADIGHTFMKKHSHHGVGTWSLP